MDEAVKEVLNPHGTNPRGIICIYLNIHAVVTLKQTKMANRYVLNVDITSNAMLLFYLTYQIFLCIYCQIDRNNIPPETYIKEIMNGEM